nr:DUF6883 domain-containing protein [Micromonospora provocatoris]
MRLLVRDAIAACVSRLIVYAAELVATAGLATPLVVEQVTTTVASWAARIARLLRGLLASLRRLMPEVRGLGDLISRLREALSRLRRQPSESPPPRDVDPPQAPHDPDAPDFRNPEIDTRKITSYAMNPEHPVGKNKYRVINAATGLGPDDAATIEQQIREGVHIGTPIAGKADQYGRRWSVDLPLTGPSGTILVRTAWILDADASAPRLVTISFPPKQG